MTEDENSLSYSDNTDVFIPPYSEYKIIESLIKSLRPFKVGRPPSFEDISSVEGLQTKMVISNLPFLLRINIISKANVLTPNGRSLALAIDHGLKDETCYAWLEIVKSSSFLLGILQSVLVRNGMDKSTLKSHIAYSAGYPKNDATMRGSQTIIDILLLANAIKEKDGIFVTSDDVLKSSEAYQFKHSNESSFGIKHRVSSSSMSVKTEDIKDSNVQIRVDVKVECNFTELDELGSKLKSLIESLKNSVNDKSSDENK